jgi:hypothetical protein
LLGYQLTHFGHRHLRAVRSIDCLLIIFFVPVTREFTLMYSLALQLEPKATKRAEDIQMYF